MSNIAYTPGLITSHLQAPVGCLMKRYRRWHCRAFAEILKAITQTLKGCGFSPNVSSDCQSKASLLKERRVSLNVGNEKHTISQLSDRLFFTARIDQARHYMILNISAKTTWYLNQAKLMKKRLIQQRVDELSWSSMIILKH